MPPLNSDLPFAEEWRLLKSELSPILIILINSLLYFYRFWVRHLVKAQWFYWFVIVLVFFNTVCVAVEHYEQPKFLDDFLCKYSIFVSYIYYVHN